LIEHGLAAAAYRYGAAAVHAFNNAPSFSNHVFNEAPELPDQLLPPPTTKTAARTAYIRLYRGAYPFEEPIHERYLLF